MVPTVRIQATARAAAGKGASRADRRRGLVPAVIYGAAKGETLVTLDPRDIMKELHKGGWQSHLYEVAVGDAAPERTLMREVQFHPVSDRPIHVDFLRLAPGVRIRVKVAVAFVGEENSPGIKEGGTLNVVRRDVEVLVDPDNVPERFEFDLSEAKIGDSLRWSAVKDAQGARPVVARDFVVATLAAPVVEEVVAPVVVAAPAAPAKKGKAAPAKAPAAAAAAPAKKK